MGVHVGFLLLKEKIKFSIVIMAYFQNNYVPALLEFCSTSFSICSTQDSSRIMLQGRVILYIFWYRTLCICFKTWHKLLKLPFIPWLLFGSPLFSLYNVHSKEKRWNLSDFQGWSGQSSGYRGLIQPYVFLLYFS